MAYYDAQITYLEDFINNPNNSELVEEMHIEKRLKTVKSLYEDVKSSKYLTRLIGTIGADPLFKKVTASNNKNNLKAYQLN